MYLIFSVLEDQIVHENQRENQGLGMWARVLKHNFILNLKNWDKDFLEIHTFLILFHHHRSISLGVNAKDMNIVASILIILYLNYTLSICLFIYE